MSAAWAGKTLSRPRRGFERGKEYMSRRAIRRVRNPAGVVATVEADPSALAASAALLRRVLVRVRPIDNEACRVRRVPVRERFLPGLVLQTAEVMRSDIEITPRRQDSFIVDLIHGLHQLELRRMERLK